VLSSNVLPAVDYPDPRGLDFDQLGEVLKPALASPALLGASVVILNPTLDDTSGTSARRIVQFLSDAVRR
jgi:arginase